MEISLFTRQSPTWVSLTRPALRASGLVKITVSLVLTPSGQLHGLQPLHVKNYLRNPFKCQFPNPILDSRTRISGDDSQALVF